MNKNELKEKVKKYESNRGKADYLYHSDVSVWRVNENLVEIPKTHEKYQAYLKQGIGEKGKDSLFVPFSEYRDKFAIQLCEKLTKEGEQRLREFDEYVRNSNVIIDKEDFPWDRWQKYKEWIENIEKKWDGFNPSRYCAIILGEKDGGLFCNYEYKA